MNDDDVRRRVTERYGEGIPVTRSFRVPDLGPNSPLRDDPPPTTRKAKGKGRKTRELEHAIQAALFKQVNDVGEILKRPALGLVFAVPNGGARSPRTAGRLKAEGVKPGVPDVWCPVARCGYHGLVIELKTPHGAVSSEQAHWIAGLEREGYKVAVHVSAFDAWAELTQYLDGPMPSQR